jgi:vanillate O-demethylase monooxygenase subunit
MTSTTPPNYPLNCWYVAATSDEVGRDLLGRRLLDRPVVLYRQESGAVVALEDRCAHRAFPLSVGRLDGDNVVCGYHGFTYDSGGRCVRIPSQPSVPAGVCVTAYPVREEPPFVWIWMGNPAASSITGPPRLPWLSDGVWGTFDERLHVFANYMLLHEHYLDFTHVFEVHPEDVPPTVETLPPLSEIVVSETSVSYSRALPPAPLADWEAEATGLARDGEYARRESGTFVSPALHLQRWEIDGPDGTVYENVRAQAFTPETPDSTHVFLRGAHDYATDRTVVTQHLQAFLDQVAAQDVAVLETIQAREGYESWARGVRVTADGAALKARRIVAAMLAEEAGRSALRPGYSR